MDNTEEEQAEEEEKENEELISMALIIWILEKSRETLRKTSRRSSIFKKSSIR